MAGKMEVYDTANLSAANSGSEDEWRLHLTLRVPVSDFGIFRKNPDRRISSSRNGCV
jgi:hypothetical protein